MTATRLRQIASTARRCPPAKLHELYVEIYGADFAGSVTLDRARASIAEACGELLARGGNEAPEPVKVGSPNPAPAEEAPVTPRVSSGARHHRTLEPL